MSTVINSAKLSNPKTLSERIKELESFMEDGLFYPSDGLKNTLRGIEGRQRRGHQVAGEIEDYKHVIAMSETIEAFPGILQSFFSADQLKQDIDDTTARIISAFEEGLKFDTQWHPYGSTSVPEDLLVDYPQEVPVEIQGDALPVSVMVRGFTLSLQSVADGHAIYSVSK